MLLITQKLYNIDVYSFSLTHETNFVKLLQEMLCQTDLRLILSLKSSLYFQSNYGYKQ